MDSASPRHVRQSAFVELEHAAQQAHAGTADKATDDNIRQAVEQVKRRRDLLIMPPASTRMHRPDVIASTWSCVTRITVTLGRVAAAERSGQLTVSYRNWTRPHKNTGVGLQS